MKKQFLKILFVVGFFVMNQLAIGQKLIEKQNAPNFTTVDVKGDTLNLEKYKGKKVFLAFFRYASCPVCNYRIHELISNYDKIQSEGYQVIAVFESSNETIQDYLKETEVPFPVIGDPKLILYKKYGVQKSFCRTIGSMFNKKTKSNLKKGKAFFKGKKLKKDGNLSRIPADFIIDEKGKITIAYYGTNIGDHLPLDRIIKE